MIVTARGHIDSALKILGVYGPGDDPTATDYADGLIWLNRMMDNWSVQRLTIGLTHRYVHALIANQAEYTIGPGADWDQPRPVWFASAGLILNNLTPSIEIPLEVLTVKDWTLQGIKDLASTQPTQIYYNYQHPPSGANAGFGLMRLWPVPQIAYQVAIYTPVAITQFADLNTQYDLAPAVAEAVDYCLAVRLARPFGQAAPADVIGMAREFLGDLKRSNVKLTDLSIDPALRGAPRSLYNWRSDTIRGR